MSKQRLSIKAKVLAIGILVSALTVVLSPATAFAAGGPDGFFCTPGPVYDHVTGTKTDFLIWWGPQANHNRTAFNATNTFTQTSTATLAVSASIGVTADASAIVAGVQVSVNTSVTASASASYGNSTTITTPPGEYGHGEYGVFRQYTSGHYYLLASNCTIGTDYGTVTAISPYTPGWDAWNSNSPTS